MSDRIASAIEAIRDLTQTNYPISLSTTYKVGGRAALFCKVEDLTSLQRVAAVAGATGLELLVLGRGSNTLFADSGYSGIVVQLGELAQGLDLPTADSEALVVVGSAVTLPVTARRTAAAGLRGFEWAVGVPGTIGGAIKMNAGGHGSDIEKSLVSVRIFSCETMAVRVVAAEELGLRFRGSALADHDIVIDATFELRWGSATEGLQEIDEIVKWRRENQPGGQNAGSVFVNPVPGEVAAGQLIDRCGLRGFRIGTAEVSHKHANFIQADPGGRAEDVVAVMEHVRQVVKNSFGFDLRSEVRLIGFEQESR